MNTFIYDGDEQIILSFGKTEIYVCPCPVCGGKKVETGDIYSDQGEIVITRIFPMHNVKETVSLVARCGICKNPIKLLKREV